jgi:flagellar protein FlaG
MMMGITEISSAATAQQASTRSLPPQASETASVRDPIKAAQEAVKAEAKVTAEARAKDEQQPRPEELQSALQKIREFVSAAASDISFSIDSDSGRSVVKVIDRSTQEVIRQIPSQEFLEMSKALDRLQGLLLKNKA